MRKRKEPDLFPTGSFASFDVILSTFRIAMHRHAKEEERTAFAETLFRQASREQTPIILSCPERI
jgi:hypothetical protein